MNAVPTFLGDDMPALGERFCQILVALLPDREYFLKELLRMWFGGGHDNDRNIRQGPARSELVKRRNDSRGFGEIFGVE